MIYIIYDIYIYIYIYVYIYIYESSLQRRRGHERGRADNLVGDGDLVSLSVGRKIPFCSGLIRKLISSSTNCTSPVSGWLSFPFNPIIDWLRLSPPLNAVAKVGLTWLVIDLDVEDKGCLWCSRLVSKIGSVDQYCNYRFSATRLVCVVSVRIRIEFGKWKNSIILLLVLAAVGKRGGGSLTSYQYVLDLWIFVLPLTVLSLGQVKCLT